MFKFFSAGLVLYVITLVSDLAQIDDGLQFIDRILTTERILSGILIYLAVWAFPRQIWPFITDQVEKRREADLSYKMALIATQEKHEELLYNLIEQITAFIDIDKKAGN